MNHKSVEEINAIMVKVVPELKSSYAKFPMSHERWYKGNEKGKKGEPCYISSLTNNGMRLDYVYGKGPFGNGYYSLLTKTAYVNLYSRVSSEAPQACCCVCNKEARRNIDEWDDVKSILHARYVSPRPDDKVAKEAALQEATTIAQAHHEFNQNEQLAFHVVGTALR